MILSETYLISWTFWILDFKQLLLLLLLSPVIIIKLSVNLIVYKYSIYKYNTHMKVRLLLFNVTLY